mgnify:CR=1 FL=1
MSLQALLGVVRHLVEVAWFLFRLYSEAEQKPGHFMSPCTATCRHVQMAIQTRAIYAPGEKLNL